MCAYLQGQKTRSTMSSPPHESTTLSAYLDLDEKVDYGSDTNVPGDEGTLYNPPVPEDTLILHQTHLPSVAKPTHPRRSIKHPMWAMSSSPICSKSNSSWLHNKRRALGTIRSLLQLLRVTLDMCSLQLRWENKHAKRPAVHWQRGPLALNPRLMLGLRADRHFARSTWSLI